MTTQLIVPDAKRPSWYERNEKTLGKAAMILGIALIAISLGCIAASAGSFTDIDKGIDIKSRWVLANAQNGQVVGTMFPIVSAALGFLICIGAGYMSYKAQKKRALVVDSSEKEQIKASAKKWKTVALVVGFVITMFAIGMILASSLLLKHQIPVMQDLINGHSGKGWQSLQASWIDPTKMKLELLLTGGIFAAIAGGGLMVAGVGLATIREKLNFRRAEKNEVAAQKATDEVL